MRCESCTTVKCMSSHAWCRTCCLIYLLCRVYKGFSVHVLFLFFLFLIRCTHHPFMCCNRCWAVFIFPSHLWGGGGEHGGELPAFELLNSCIHPWFRHRAVEDNRCEFVCCRHQLVSFHEALPYFLFLRQVTKQWGRRRFPRGLCCFWLI